MTLIVVDLLRSFINQQAKLGGPFDTPEAFYAAMQEFLNDDDARHAIDAAWLKHKIDQSLNSTGPFYTHEEAFARIKQRTDQQLEVQMREVTRGITSDRQAIDILLGYIDDVHSCMGGLEFDTFSSIGLRYMRLVVERAIQAVSQTLWVLPLAITDTLDQADLKRLKALAERIPTISEPVPPVELWEAVEGIFPRLEKVLSQWRVPA
jgi:hypothetical protein